MSKKSAKRSLPSDIEIAQKAKLRPIDEIAKELGIAHKHLHHYGPYKAKVSLEVLKKTRKKPGNLILVSAMTPTPAGEGKTTTTVGLGQAICALGHKAAIAIREPSLGPCMGIKGGAAGGGMSQVLPMEDINLHFTGDIHAVGAAHNLLAAVIDNHIYQDNTLDLDPRRLVWNRVVDMNDRSLRDTVIGLGGTTQGVPRETGFDITVASEVMAILCLANDIADLKKRLGNILIGFTHNNEPRYARDLNVQGAMAALLKDALRPNLVQTLEGGPAFIHGGPFANIAHGCNSVLATKMALATSDYVVTEAGFGFDLGAEKFLDIKCRYAGLVPSAIVLVATVRALKLHGGVPLPELGKANLEAVKRGIVNLEKHIENARRFGVPLVVAVNRFSGDHDKEVEWVVEWCRQRQTHAAISNVWEQGGKGGAELAEMIVEHCNRKNKTLRPLYDWHAPVQEKIRIIARQIYGADDVEYQPKALKDLKLIEDHGFAGLPICMAKTQNSLSDNAKALGRPRDFNITVREIKISAGAGFLIPIAGNILRMPGLPKVPAAQAIDIDNDGRIKGLF